MYIWVRAPRWECNNGKSTMHKEPMYFKQACNTGRGWGMNITGNLRKCPILLNCTSYHITFPFRLVIKHLSLLCTL